MKSKLLLLVIGMALNSCMAQNSFDPNSTPVAKLEGGTIVLTVDEATLVNSVRAAKEGVIQVNNIRAENENEFSYLLFEVVTGSQTISYAIQLSPKTPGSPLLLASGTTHSCDGYCCESCAFEKNTAGEIIGCWCKRAAATVGCQTEARCDHSMSSTSGTILE